MIRQFFNPKQSLKFINYIENEKRFSVNTVLSYRNDLTQFFTYLETQLQIENVKEVKHIQIRGWVVTLMEEKLTARSVNRKLSCLKTFFKFLQKH